VDFFAARVSEKLRWGPRGSPTKSVRVRSALLSSVTGPVGSGRARVVEFSLNTARIMAISRDLGISVGRRLRVSRDGHRMEPVPAERRAVRGGAK